MTRRGLLFGAAAPRLLASKPHPLIDTHVHLFLPDQKNFPYHPHAPYKPPSISFDDYIQFVRQAGIDHVVVVHPEPYQDDHRELEYVFAHEPSPEFFKGTCLFDPIAKDTPARMEALVKKFPGRIAAIRIHEVRSPGKPPLSAPKAITAAAHKLARIIFHLVTTGQEFDDTRFAADQLRYLKRQENKLRAKAHALGFQLTPLENAG
ncbi:MAG: amidohydrolase family protein [Acidobacteriota bacterium]|nr:amidohydrolase family protein [Acidobacteriota bacterium]